MKIYKLLVILALLALSPLDRWATILSHLSVISPAGTLHAVLRPLVEQNPLREQKDYLHNYPYGHAY